MTTQTGKLRWLRTPGLIVTTIGLTLYVERWVEYIAEGGAKSKSGHDDHDGHGDGDEHADEHGTDEHGTDEHAGHEDAKRVKITDEGRRNAGIEIGTAGPGKVHVTISLPGDVRVNAERVSHVSPRVGGVAREINAKLGDVVKRGDVLALLDSRELTGISRDMRATSERVKLAEANLLRIEKLYKDGISPEKDFLSAKNELATAQIERDSAAEALASTGTGGGGVYKLIAPLDGTIIEKHLAVGEVVSNTEPTFIIADLSSLWVDLTVYSKDLAWISVGQPVRIRTEGIKESAAGAVTFLSATASGEARTTNARVVLNQPPHSWKPGLFVTGDVAIEEIDAAIVVPEDSVQTLDGRTVVFVEHDEVFEGRPVKVGHIGLRPDGRTKTVEILEGLATGDRIVTKGAFTLRAELGKGSAGHEH